MTPEEYKVKREARAARFSELAAKARAKADAAYNQQQQIGEMIPMGQPILVDHYSARRHRRDIERINRLMKKSCEESEKAKYYETRAASVDSAIRSDDPEALTKLEEKLAALQKSQDVMREANKRLRKSDLETLSKDPDFVALVGQKGIEAMQRNRRIWGSAAFERFALNNNSAEMRRTRERIEQIKKAAAIQTSETLHDIDGGTVKMIVNTDLMRVQLVFDFKPTEALRTVMKGHGFKWSPTNEAWQRLLNGNAIYWAKHIIQSWKPALQG